MSVVRSARKQEGNEPTDGDETEWKQAGEHGTADASGCEGRVRDCMMDCIPRSWLWEERTVGCAKYYRESLLFALLYFSPFGIRRFLILSNLTRSFLPYYEPVLSPTLNSSSIPLHPAPARPLV